MRRVLRAAAGGLVAVALCACASGNAFSPASRFGGDAARRPGYVPLDRQTLGQQWSLYSAAPLENTYVLATIGKSIVGTSPLQNRFTIFDPVTSAVTASFAPGTVDGQTPSQPVTTIAGTDGRAYFVGLQGSPVLGRFTVTSPPVFSYCTLPALPTGALTQDPATGTLYVGDQRGDVDAVAWSGTSCTVTSDWFTDPISGGYLYSLAVGWSGHVFLGDASGYIVEIAGGSLVTTYTLANAQPVNRGTNYDLTALYYDAATEQLWFEQPLQAGIGRLAEDGTMIDYGLNKSAPYGIAFGTSQQSMTLGPDGNIWSATGYGNLWKISPSAGGGAPALAVIPPQYSAATYLTGITVGPDRQIYASDVNTDRLFVYNYAQIVTSKSSVKLKPKSSKRISVQETDYTGIFRVSIKPRSVAKVSISGRWLTVRWKHSGKAVVTITDSLGNSTELPVTAD